MLIVNVFMLIIVCVSACLNMGVRACSLVLKVASLVSKKLDTPCLASSLHILSMLKSSMN